MKNLNGHYTLHKIKINPLTGHADSIVAGGFSYFEETISNVEGWAEKIVKEGPMPKMKMALLLYSMSNGYLFLTKD
jgi:hypothetical protein